MRWEPPRQLHGTQSLAAPPSGCRENGLQRHWETIEARRRGDLVEVRVREGPGEGDEWQVWGVVGCILKVEPMGFAGRMDLGRDESPRGPRASGPEHLGGKELLIP